MISYSKKFIFIHIPRTAGTSIEKALVQYDGGDLNTDSGRGGIWSPDRELRSKMLTILGEDKTKNSKHLTALDWKKVLGEEYDEYYKFTIIRHPLSKAASMYRFNGHSPHDNPDWLNFQSLYFEDKQGNVIVDDIFKYEELEKSWEIICNKLDIEFIPLPHKNKLIKTDEKKYKGELQSLFQKEIIKLGYE